MIRGILRRAAILAAAIGVLAAAALLFGVDRADLVLDGVLVLLAALVAATAARLAAAAFPAPRGVVPRALTSRPEPYSPPDSLARTEDLVALGQADALDFHFRLRPLLVAAAAAGLGPATAARGVLPLSAESRLRPGTWELLRPDRPRPAAQTPGVDDASLAAVLDDLESILPP